MTIRFEMFDGTEREWFHYVIYDTKSMYYDRNDAWMLRVSVQLKNVEGQSTYFYNPVRNVTVN